MDKSTDKGSREKESSKELDLSDLQNFNFASNWSESTSSAPRERESHQGGPRRERERRPDRRPPGAGENRPRGGERPDRRPAGRGERRGPERGPRQEERPNPLQLLRESPFDVQIYPDEAIFAKLTNAMRHSLRTYELFEVSRLVLEKPDRFQVGLRFHGNGNAGGLLFQSVPDGLPFLTEEAAIDHVLRSHLDQFFTVEEVEVDPPKGSFQFIARCTLTGDFLSPPNYHRYQSILLHYHQEKFSHMPFERFRANVETVKDDEAVEKWLESMKTQTRYQLAGAAEGQEQTMDSPEAVRAYLLQQVKDKVVRPAKSVRLSGKQVEELSADIRPYVVAYVEHQKRFPLDTANTLRGRLRRQHFFIYKKGARGISFVCAIKRKFRQPDQVFSDTVQSLIAFLEQNDQVHASELTEKFLGISPPAEPKIEAAGEGEVEGTAAGGSEPEIADPGAQEKIKRLSLDLRWLLSEGYVTEFSDGRLSVHPVVLPAPVEKREKKSVPASEKPAPVDSSEATPPIEAGPAVESSPDQSVGEVKDAPPSMNEDEVGTPAAEPTEPELPVVAENGNEEPTLEQPKASPEPESPPAESEEEPEPDAESPEEMPSGSERHPNGSS